MKIDSAARTRLDWSQVISVMGSSKTLCTFLGRLQMLQNKGIENVPAASLSKAGLPWDRTIRIEVVRDFDKCREAREIVCGAITFVEDWLDYEFPNRVTLRNKIANIRRRLEDELHNS